MGISGSMVFGLLALAVTLRQIRRKERSSSKFDDADDGGEAGPLDRGSKQAQEEGEALVATDRHDADGEARYRERAWDQAQRHVSILDH
jgi:hypothetical protein